MRSQTTSTATTLAPGRVGGDGGDVLNSSNAHTSTSQSTESALGTGAGGLGASSTGSTELDVEGSDTDFAASGSNVLGSQHGSVGGRLITIGLDLHAASDTGDGLTTRKIGNMDEGVVERGEDVGNAEDELAISDLRAELDGGFFLGGLDFLGGHGGWSVQMASQELASTYAALILADDGIEITSDKIVALTSAANVELEPIWASLLAKALEGKNVKELLSNVGSGGGAPAPGAAAAAGGAAAAAEEAPKEEKKEEEKEESDDDMGFGLFD